MTDISNAIEDHAIIGDLHTIALVGLDGTIDFLCVPRLDGPSVFASLLDPDAGSFTVRVAGDRSGRRQMYLPDTNIVLTRFASSAGIVEVTDFMVVGQSVDEPVLVRTVTVVRGSARITVTCAPRFDYGRSPHDAAATGDAVDFLPHNGAVPLRLIAAVGLTIDGAAATATFDLGHGESRSFVFGRASDGIPAHSEGVAQFAAVHFAATLAFWQNWSQRSTYRGRWRELVMRSALTLKLLVSADNGSIAAAATFGLPEAPGGARNWDYRYVWIRDASFTVYAFIRLGYIEEAKAFMGWLAACFAHEHVSDPIRPMYRLDGAPDIPEIALENLRGYGGAHPVRIGNGANGQLQLDSYGALFDAVYLTSKYGGAISLDAWSSMSRHVDWICDHWRDPDEGIWEQRNGRRERLHSRVMCWVAVDRAVRLAQKRSLPAALERWDSVRSEIHRSIVPTFWNAEIAAFARSANSDEVDASALMLPLTRFMGARDPRWKSTQARIEATLVEDAFVYRYKRGSDIDGLPGDEGAFTTCSFWLVECIVRGGDTERARLLFEKMISYGNHVGLFSEELGRSGEQLGNFPQALTHLALISAAMALDDALSGKPTPPWK